MATTTIEEFIPKPAVREGVPLLIGLAGGTGSGKTLSAMKLAKGMSGGKPFCVIDTESGRAKAYAPEGSPIPRNENEFQFDHIELFPPFRPERYLNAILAMDRLGKYPVIVVDSASHEYAGEGGLLEWQEELLDEFVERALKRETERRSRWELEEANKRRSWIEPKMSHKKYVQRLTQIRSHLILCFRAEPKTEQSKDPKTGKTVIGEKQGLTGYKGWFPICEKNMPYELTDYFLLMGEQPGCPLPIKLMDKHKPYFPKDTPITEEAGVKLAAWAKGSGSAPSAGLGATVSAQTEPAKTAKAGGIDRDQAKEIMVAFERALPDALRKNAVPLFQEWLGSELFLDKDSNPAASSIPAAEFEKHKKQAVDWAASKKSA